MIEEELSTVIASTTSLRKKTKYVLNILEINPHMFIDEILLELKRKYNIEVTQRWLVSTLYILDVDRKNCMKKSRLHFVTD